MLRTEQIREEQQLLAEAFEAWRQTYEITNPAPEKLASQRFEEDWWSRNKRIWQSMVWALGLYVAARTGWGIHNANVSEGFNFYVSLFITILAVWGIEGFIANYGFHRPRKLELSRVGEFFERSLGWISLCVGIIISSAAGLEISMNVAPNVRALMGDSVDTVLSIVLGVGLTFVLFGISEFVGRLKWVNEHKPLIAEHEHQLKLQAYREQVKAEWRKSTVYLELMAEKEVARQQAQFDIDNATYKRRDVLKARAEAAVKKVEASNEPSTEASIEASTEGQTEGQTEDIQTYPGYKADLVKEYMSANATSGHQPTIPEIQEWVRSNYGVGVSSGTVSEARRQWYEEFDPFIGR